MDEDEKISIYNKGIKQGQEHQNPSPKTLEIFKIMEDKMDKLEEKINSIAIDIAHLPEKIIDKCDTKYASKETEGIVKGLQGWVVKTGITIILLMGSIIAILIYSQSQLR